MPADDVRRRVGNAAEYVVIPTLAAAALIAFGTFVALFYKVSARPRICSIYQVAFGTWNACRTR